MTNNPWDKLNDYEYFALAQVLCEIPISKTYDEIIEMIRNSHEEIGIWEQMEYWDTEIIIDFIDTTLCSLETTFISRNFENV